jgi:ubiquinone/menaquinone biosynthesis C-methylase UbiE
VANKSSLIDQCRKPTGWIGRFQLWSMNSRHSKVTDWGLAHVSIGQAFKVLDVGCGGGRTISKLAAIATEGKVYGIDHSEESVAASRKTNAKRVGSGRVEIQQGWVSRLPFPADMFDLVTAVETHFFWPNLPGDIREILRVLKSGGTLIIIAEIYKGAGTRTGKLAEKYFPMAGMTLLTPADHRDLFAEAGYTDVEVLEKPEKGWICCLGKKP